MPSSKGNKQAADALGVTEGAIRKAEREGRITRERDGSWNLPKITRQWAENTDPAKQRDDDTRAVPNAAIAAVDQAADQGDGGLPGGMTLMRARTANEVIKARRAQLLYERLKDSLVDRQRARDHVFRLARDERDAWLTWPNRVAAEMAAELQVDEHAMITMLDRYVRQHLDELAQVELAL